VLCWKTSTYLLLTLRFATEDLGLLGGGGPAPDNDGVGGADATSPLPSVGTRLDRARAGGFLGGELDKSTAEAGRAGGGLGESMLNARLGGVLELTGVERLGDAVCTLDGGGGGAAGAEISAPAFLFTHFFSSLS